MSPDPGLPRILILGGTRDARMLADRLVDAGCWHVISSLAGRTKTPALPKGEVRMGGFGGTAALAIFLREQDIQVVVDATHPFATAITANAVTAAKSASRRYLRLCRAPWVPGVGDHWRIARDVEHAARLIPTGVHAFITIGRQQLAPFLNRRDIRILARMIERPDGLEVASATTRIIAARGPFDVAGEISLMRREGIDVLVTKNAGGDEVAAKLLAARDLGLPVIMIKRLDLSPNHASHSDATTVEALIALLDHDLA